MKNQLTIITPPIKDGKTGFGLQIVEAFKALEGKRVKITIEEFKKPRSNAQNKYYWAVVIKAYQRVLHYNNQMFDVDGVHDFIKEYVWQLYVDVPVGNFSVRHFLPSSVVTIQEWENMMMQCRAFAAKEFQIDIPEPQEKMPEFDVPDGLYYDYDYKNYFKIVNSTAEVMLDLKEASRELAYITK